MEFKSQQIPYKTHPKSNTPQTKKSSAGYFHMYNIITVNSLEAINSGVFQSQSIQDD